MRRSTVILAALALSTPLAWGVGLGFMSDTPLTRLTPAQMDSLTAAVDQALSSSKDGEATTWTTPDTDPDSKRATTVEIKPTSSYQRQGHDCRKVQLSFTSKVQNDRMTPAYCKTDDGSWKLQPVGKKKSKASAAQ